MACRHQSQWQLLISPLHKRQEIIRMDQSTTICVCVCARVCTRVPREISWILISLKGKKRKRVFGWIAMHLHLRERVCFLCMLWRRSGWLTGPVHYDPCEASGEAYKWLTNHTHIHTTHTHKPNGKALSVTNKCAMCGSNECACINMTWIGPKLQKVNKDQSKSGRERRRRGENKSKRRGCVM